MKNARLAVLLLFSGAGALVLEVGWFRRMAQVAGATSVAMGAVLAAVIGGMALGAWLFGPVADRARAPTRLYGWLEVGIAAGALLTPSFMDLARPGFDWLQRGLEEWPASLAAARFAFATLLLAPPAILMGGTLPALACAAEVRGGDRGRVLGWLYAANTLGAVAGTLTAGFLLIPGLGLAGCMRAAAVFSGLAAAGAFLVREARGGPRPLAGPRSPAPDARRAVLLYAASGFLGLAAEVAFVRSLVLVFGSTTYAFTTMLAVFLFGIGVGGAVGARLARREEGHLRLLENTVALTAALFALAALGVYYLPRLYLLGHLATDGAFLPGLWLRGGLATMVLLPGALGLGVAFPLAAHIASAGSMGAGTGRLYAANTLGSILGSTAAVFFFVPALGPQQAVVAPALMAGIVAVGPRRRRIPLILLMVAALGLLPPAATARERLLGGVYFHTWAFTKDGAIDEGSWDAGVDIGHFDYGREATVAVWRWYGTSSLLIDGKAVATDQVLGDDHHLALLGHLPLALHAAPKRALVVGLGMGTTYKACAAHALETLRVVELEEAVAGAARRLGAEPRDLVIADGRSYLRATRETFDVITSDPIHPWVRGGGDLYTVEYFTSCLERLAPGGVVCQWLPIYQMGVADLCDVARTFGAVFPHAAAYYGGGDIVLVGSAEPVRSPRTLAGAAREALERLGTPDLAELKMTDRVGLLRAAGSGPLLTDDALKLEFSTPRQLDNHDVDRCFAWLRALWTDPPAFWAQILAAQNELYADADDWGFMLVKLAAALELRPENPFALRFRGERHLAAAEHLVRVGDLESAAAWLVRARRDLGDDPRVTGTEADLREARGDRAGARELLEKVLALTPDSAYLQRRIARLR